MQLHPSGNELLLNGRAPNEGDVFFMPNLAKVLRGIAEAGPAAFYKGPVAEKNAA